MGFEHYKYLSGTKNNNDLFQDIIASRKAEEATANAERERASHFAHKARMEGFRAWVKGLDLTDDQKGEMIKASFRW